MLIANGHSKAVFDLLSRRGVYLRTNEEQVPMRKVKRSHFSRNPLLQPVGKSVAKLSIIEKYLQLGQALEMTYRAPGYAPENGASRL